MIIIYDLKSKFRNTTILREDKMVIKIEDNSYKTEVLDHKGYVLIDFYADWCGPCKQIAPILDELSAEMKDKIKICKMNIDESPETPSSLGIRSIPTLIIFENGKAVATKMGSMQKSVLKDWIDEETK